MREYLVPTGYGEAAFAEKRSRFTGRIWLCRTEDEALAALEQTRQAHWDASHNVYAYIIHDGAARYSDDGEPGGTAGMPIYDVLSKNGITDVVCVVTRYFGGILLGTGGLVHAYSKGASMALANSEIVTMEVADSLKISCDYTMYGIISSVLPEYEAIIRNTEYTDSVCVFADVRTELTDSLTAKLIDKCNGKVNIEKLARGYVEF